ncbi:hypothetical protein ABZX51_011349 [Aspergillus tubingensis]
MEGQKSPHPDNLGKSGPDLLSCAPPARTFKALQMNLPSRTANPSVHQSRHGWLGSDSCRYWMYYISSRDQRQIQSGRSVILSWATGSLFMRTAPREGSVQNRQRPPANDPVVGLGST